MSSVHGGEANMDSMTDLKTFETGYASALQRNDVAALKNYLSDTWKIVSGDGQIITRERFLEVLTSGDLKHDTMSSQDGTTTLYGDTAIVTARTQSGGHYKGVEFHTDEMATDIVVRIDGKWVCVFTQLSTVGHGT
jgi:ketosteroid isomerase-like protein